MLPLLIRRDAEDTKTMTEGSKSEVIDSFTFWQIKRYECRFWTGRRLLVKWPTWRTILFCVFIISLTLYMFRAHRAHHQKRQIMSIQLLVAVTLCRWPCRVQVGCSLPTCTRHGHRQLPEVVLTQFVSPDDEHDVLETCRGLKIKINT
jgi:hypothetical protein